MFLKDEALSDPKVLRDVIAEEVAARVSSRALKRVKTDEDDDPCFSVQVFDPKDSAGYTAVEFRPGVEQYRSTLSIPIWLANEFGRIGENPDVCEEWGGAVYDISGCTREEVVQFMVRLAEFYVK